MKRYPGIYNFEKKHKNVFFGRDNDIEKMLTMINVKSLITLNAKSGIGKTSLLEAGVLPRLPQNFVHLKIRFYGYNKHNPVSPVKRITNEIEKRFEVNDENTILSKINEDEANKDTLWYKFKTLQLTDKEEKTYILVFDQFEELFHYPPKEIEEFKNQIHELLHIKLPAKYTNNLRQKSKQFPDIVNRKSLLGLQKKQNLKVIFAVRSDRLSNLNKLSDKLPNIQNNFYELQPLSNEQARQAIENPAKKESEDFSTKPFTFTEEAIDAIVNKLTQERQQPIETTQLQIVCQRIEDIAQEKSRQNKDVEITVADLPKFQDIFFDFYETSVSKTIEKSAVQKFIEDQLIRNRQRISLDEIICNDYIKPESLKILTNAHLLRAERNSTGGFSYELSHDTLIEPILVSRKQRVEKEEKQRAEAERLEEIRIAKEKAEEERIEREKERKQQRKITKIVGIAAIVSIAFGIFGFINMKKAQNQLKNAVKYQIMGKTKDATQFKNDELFTAAVGKYEELLEIYQKYPQFEYDSVAVRAKINECKKLDSIKENFDNYMNTADSLIDKLELHLVKEAYENYKKARELDYEYAEKTFKQFNIKLEQAEEDLKISAESALEAGYAGQKIAQETNEFLEMIKKDKQID